jgi:hypothetical protein
MHWGPPRPHGTARRKIRHGTDERLTETVTPEMILGAVFDTLGFIKQTTLINRKAVNQSICIKYILKAILMYFLQNHYA